MAYKLTKYSWVMQFISHEHPSFHKESFKIELGSLDFNMVSESPLGCWADLPPIVVHVFGWSATRESILKRESESFKIELGLLDFNRTSTNIIASTIK
jgi:hypothetical protein